MIVVDASVVFDYLMHTEDRAEIERRFQIEDFDLHAPGHFPVELLSGFHKRALLPNAVHNDEDVVRDILIFPVEIHSYQYLVSRIWELRHNITPYDAAYVALAEVLDAPLLTRDRKLARSTGHDARIEVI